MLSTDTEHCSGETEAWPCTCGRTERDKTDKTINTPNLRWMINDGSFHPRPAELINRIVQIPETEPTWSKTVGILWCLICQKGFKRVTNFLVQRVNHNENFFKMTLMLMLNFYTCQIQIIPKMKEKNKWIRNQIQFFLLWKTGWLPGFLAGVAPVGAAIVRPFEKPDVKLHYVKN